MTKQFPDGLLEIKGSGNTREPGFVGQAGTRSSMWFRINGGSWMPLVRGASNIHYYDAMECADTVVEFQEYVWS